MNDNDNDALHKKPGPIGASILALRVSGSVVNAPNVLSVRHLERIRGGLLYAATSAVTRAILHARTFDKDVLCCCHCGGRLRVRAVIADPGVAWGILASLAGTRDVELVRG